MSLVQALTPPGAPIEIDWLNELVGSPDDCPPGGAQNIPFLDPLPQIPPELKDLPRWLIWKSEKKGDGKPTKVPYDAKNGKRASASNPGTWCDYQTAVSASSGYDGVGLIVSEPYVAIDLDKCRSETGEVELWAQKIIDEVGSYTEVSPSGNGFHIWVYGKLLDGKHRCGRFEMYNRDRYFTVTGKHLAGTPETIETRDLSSLHSRIETLDPKNAEKNAESPGKVTVPDRFARLMEGRWEGLYPSQSEADIALCVLLARGHDCDSQKIDAELRKSGLYRDKWERKDYRERTVNKAIEVVRREQRAAQEYEFEELRAGSGGSPPKEETLDWRSTFKSYQQLEQGAPKFLIPGFLPAGITFIAGLPGTGKTWLALSIAKALTTQRPFLGHYDVPAVVPVIYLTPEVGEKSFRARLEKMRLTNVADTLLCRTMEQTGFELDDSYLLGAVETLKPAVILDTAIRFSHAENENSPTDNRQLVNGIYHMLKKGAQAVIGVHHATKASASASELTLENALRGTGDLGAICDAAWGLRIKNEKKLEIEVKCVKARDFEAHPSFKIIGRPDIDDGGDFLMVETTHRGEEEALVSAIHENRNADYKTLHQITAIPVNRIGKVAKAAGWQKQRKKPWEETRQASG